MTTTAELLSGKWFKEIEPKSMARFLSTAADVALVIDKNGFIRDIASHSRVFQSVNFEKWVGNRWADIVTIESKPKVDELIKAANGNAPLKWRQLNHPTPNNKIDIPVQYYAMTLGPQNRIVAFGKELSSTAELQQRLVASQQLAEHEYSRIRMTETRYRALFQMSLEAVLIVDADSLKVSELNPAAVKLIGGNARKVLNRPAFDLAKDTSKAALEALFDGAHSSPEPRQDVIELAKDAQACKASVSLFRQEGGKFFLVRLNPIGAEQGLQPANANFIEVVSQLPDGFVVTDESRRVLLANQAFLELTELGTEEQIKGQSIDRWIGGSRVDVDLLFASLREHGSVHRFSTVVDGELGSQRDIEISAVAIESSEKPCFGFSIRTIPRQTVKADHIEESLPRTVQQMTELVGRVPLKDLIRDTTDIIERLCIEAALELTDDNRASAAEILGLSRQSLYVKLRRYGLIDSEPSNLN